MSTVQNGNTVSVHYRGTLVDGTEFDNSYDRGETLTFEVGAGQMIGGFDAGVVGMQVGEIKNVAIASDQAYGPRRPEAIQEMPKSKFPPDFVFATGATVHGTDPDGRPMIATILREHLDDVELDFNHPMAGRDLNFQIELVSINEDNN